MKRIIVLTLAALAVAALAAAPASAKSGGKKANVKTWRITIENLTTGQPLSPPIWMTHKKKAKLFQVGQMASHAFAPLAEDADTSLLEAGLPKLRGVYKVGVGTAAPIGPGATASFEVMTKRKFNRLSLATMGVNTNDAFTGVNSYRLRGKSRMIFRQMYDAGTEANTELPGDIPGPCCGMGGVRVAEGDVIRHHDGILGVTDGIDPAAYNWDVDKPVMKVTIERIS